MYSSSRRLSSAIAAPMASPLYVASVSPVTIWSFCSRSLMIICAASAALCSRVFSTTMFC